MKNVDFHRVATNELIDASHFYEGQLEGLGARLIDEVESACANLSQHPEAGSPLGIKDRKWLLQRFPYSIVFREHADGLLVLAVMHQHRKPGYWKWRRYKS